MNYSMEELLPVVRWLSEKYTSKESASVTYETANQLMAAVIYCIEEWESDGRNQSRTAVYDASGKLDARKAYDMGYELTFQKVVAAKDFYGKIVKGFRAYGNRSYHDTIVKGMPEFFRSYDVRFCPQEHLLTLDYPTIKAMENQRGVDAIRSYLEFTWLEQSFLKRFPEAYVREVAAAQNPDYKSLFLNVAGMVLRHVLGCMMAEIKVQTIRLCQTDYDKIKAVVEHGGREELELQLKRLLELLMSQGFKPKTKLYQYLEADSKDFAGALINAAEHNCLRSVI